MSSTVGFRLTCFAAIFLIAVGSVVGRPISSGRPSSLALRTSVWSSANLADDLQALRLADSRSNKVVRTHDTRRFVGPDVTSSTANYDHGAAAAAAAAAAASRWSGMIKQHDAATSAQFFDDYASVDRCGMFNDCCFAENTWFKYLEIFMITLGTLVVVIMLFWTLCYCCMCRRDSTDSCCVDTEENKSSGSTCCDNTTYESRPAQ